MRPGGTSTARSIAGGTVGNLVEWFDFYVYSAFSLYFAQAFFPKRDATAQLLNTAAVFAIGFLMRPIGGWLLGIFADRRGRKAALTLSVLLMCGGSGLIALTPSYDRIGVAAPVLLVIARLLQGLSVGGEYGASATYLSEMAGAAHRGLIASFQYVTLIGGQLLALAVLLVLQAVLTEAELHAWGWRIPFVVGGALALVALALRRSLAETAAFVAVAPAARRNPWRELRPYAHRVVLVVMLGAGGSLAFYTFTTYMQKFLVNTVGWSKPDASRIAFASLAVYMLIQPLFGALSDRFGRKPQLIAYGVLGLVGTVPLLTALTHPSSHVAAFALIVLALTVLSGFTAISGLIKAELFPANVRVLGVGLPYGISVSLFGGTAEYVALRFKSAGHEAWFFWYVAVVIGMSLIAIVLLPDTKRTSLIV